MEMRPPSRTYSSPEIEGHRNRWPSSERKKDVTHQHYEDLFFVIGDRVLLDGRLTGSVAYFGETEFGGGGDWVGVALDEPAGSHDGRLRGRSYFQCEQNHGIFVRPNRLLRLCNSSRQGRRSATPSPANQCEKHQQTGNSGDMRSPSKRSLSQDRFGDDRLSSNQSSRLTTPSFYYDDDFRLEKFGDSLERRLRANLESLSSNWNSSTTPVTQSILKNNQKGMLRDKTPEVRPPTREFTKTELDSLDDVEPCRSSSSGTPTRSESVFHFYPRREKLDENDDRNTDTPTIIRHSQAPHRNESHPRVAWQQSEGEERVLVMPSSPKGRPLAGVLKFLGETDFATGEWAGVELDSCEGRNDGSVLGRRYFRCAPNHGLFVPATRLHRLGTIVSDGSGSSFGQVRSTITSPPPAAPQTSRSLGSSGSTSRSVSANSTSSSQPLPSRFTETDFQRKLDDQLDRLLGASGGGNHSAPNHIRSVTFTFAKCGHQLDPLVSKTVEFNNGKSTNRLLEKTNH